MSRLQWLPVDVSALFLNVVVIFKVSDSGCKKQSWAEMEGGGVGGGKGEKQKHKVKENQMGSCGQNGRRFFPPF